MIITGHSVICCTNFVPASDSISQNSSHLVSAPTAMAEQSYLERPNAAAQIFRLYR